jgi:hypothetical protein
MPKPLLVRASPTSQQALELEEAAAQEVLSAAHVVAATCIAAGDPRLVAEVCRVGLTAGSVKGLRLSTWLWVWDA